MCRREIEFGVYDKKCSREEQKAVMVRLCRRQLRKIEGNKGQDIAKKSHVLNMKNVLIDVGSLSDWSLGHSRTVHGESSCVGRGRIIHQGQTGEYGSE